jgi:hypothetical protein
MRMAVQPLPLRGRQARHLIDIAVQLRNLLLFGIGPLCPHLLAKRG